MTKQELDKTLKTVNENPEWYCQLNGINPNAITKFVIELTKQPIDFSVLSINWICINAIKWHIDPEAVDLTVSECMVSEDEFEDICSNEFKVYNPLIYMYIKEAASHVDEKLITLDTKVAYYNKKLNEAILAFGSTINDEELERIQFEIDYYNDIIEKITNKTK